MLRKAYSLVRDIKSLDGGDGRMFSGIATSPVTDRMGDVIEPMGVKYAKTLPLLLYHDSKRPVGEATFGKPSPTGVPFQAQISTIDRAGAVKDRLDEAADSLRATPPLIRGVSIGFRELEQPEYINETGGYRYPSIEVLELSMVVIPANQAATIDAVKEFDVHRDPVEEEKGAVAPHSTATTDKPWDGPAAKANLPSPLPVEKAKAAFAWYDASKISNGEIPKDAAKFIHHEVSADGSVGAANLTACSAGIAVLNGGRGGTNIPSSDDAGVYAHLARHLKDAGKTPPPLKALAATGTKGTAAHLPSGVSDTSRVSMRTDRTMKKSYADQIAQWEATRAAKTARMDELLTKSGDAGVTLDEAEQEEHDTLDAEVKKIDAQLVRLRSAEEREKNAAKVVTGATADEGGRSRTSVIVAEKKLPKGIGFARLAMCVAMAKGSQSDAERYAKQFYPDDSNLFQAIRVKAAVGAGAADVANWASDLVPYNILMNDFIEFLRAGNIVDKFGQPNPGGGGDYPALRKVPFNVRVSGASAGLTGHWVGEGLPGPLSKMTTFNTTLTWAKVEAIAALTKEEIRFSNPSAEAKVRDDIGRAINQRIDIDFVDPALAAVANVSPASITSGVVATPPTGSAASNVITDLSSLIKQFAINNLDPSDIVLIMSAQMALQLSMMTTSLGYPYFPQITMKGGMLRGFPVIASENLTAVGSPSTQTIVAVKASDVYLADDGVVTVEASDQASLEMLDSSLVQDGTAGTGTSLVSLWQAGLLGIKAQREITWKLRRATAVQYISPAAYAA